MSTWDFSTTPPGVVDYTAEPTTTAPGNAAPAALSNTAPDVKAPAALTDHPPAALPWGEAGPASLPSNMASAFVPAFINVSGEGPTLKSLNASVADAAAGRILQGTINGKLASYQVRAGDDAETAVGIIRPANFDAENNAVVFVKL